MRVSKAVLFPPRRGVPLLRVFGRGLVRPIGRRRRVRPAAVALGPRVRANERVRRPLREVLSLDVLRPWPRGRPRRDVRLERLVVAHELLEVLDPRLDLREVLRIGVPGRRRGLRDVGHGRRAARRRRGGPQRALARRLLGARLLLALRLARRGSPDHGTTPSVVFSSCRVRCLVAGASRRAPRISRVFGRRVPSGSRLNRACGELLEELLHVTYRTTDMEPRLWSTVAPDA